MRVAYVDTSCFVAVAFDEPGAARLAETLASFDELISSNLLEAELRAAFAREDVAFEEDFLTGLSWMLPDRPLSAELARALGAGYLRGADLWHVAAALGLPDLPDQMWFLTLDQRQTEVAGSLGFQTLADL